MDFSESHYYELHKALLCVIGQWPYQKTWIKILTRCIIQFVTLSSCFLQLVNLIMCKHNLSTFIELLPPLVTIFMGAIAFLIIYINADVFKQMHLSIVEDWNSEKNEEEAKIKHFYGKISYYIVKYSIVMIVLVVVGSYLTTALSGRILDVVFPLNESRGIVMGFRLDYFTEEREVNFYLILLHSQITITVFIVVVIANQITMIVIFLHVFGMFEVLGYRLQNCFGHDKSLGRKVHNIKKDSNYRIMVLCIERHQKIIELVDLMQLYYSPILFVVALGLLIVVCLSLVLITNFEKVTIFYLAFGGGQCIFGLLNILFGQRLINLSYDISKKVYDSMWYNTSVEVQKLLILMLNRSYQPCMISAYNVVVLSAETLRSFLQTVLSYYTVIRNFQ